MSEEQDRQIVGELKKRVLKRFDVKSWSFDKGYWTKENKELLSEDVAQVIMPKLGKRNHHKQQYETSRSFKKLKNKHSAIESNINELEHSGLDRCLERGAETLPEIHRLRRNSLQPKKNWTANPGTRTPSTTAVS